MTTHPSIATEVESRQAMPRALKQDVGEPEDWTLLDESAAVRQLRSQIQRIAPHFRVALIRNEYGSRKPAIAKAIHALSPGAHGRLVTIDASLLTVALNSNSEDPGCRSCVMKTIEAARDGTLHLTGVAELSLERQATLYRFLRRAEERDGSLCSGLRVLAESDRDLRTLASIGQFRQDLCALLTAVEILVPPQRQQSNPASEDAPQPVETERLDSVIRRHVLEVLTRCSGNKVRTAEVLGISRSTLYRMLDARPTSLQRMAD